MDQSPYTPGAGHNPPVLAGRDGLLRDCISMVRRRGARRRPPRLRTPHEHRLRDRPRHRPGSGRGSAASGRASRWARGRTSASSTTRGRRPTARSGSSTTACAGSAAAPARCGSASTARRARRRSSAAVQHPLQILAGTQGNAQPLPNGDTFFGWGSQGRISELSPDGGAAPRPAPAARLRHVPRLPPALGRAARDDAGDRGGDPPGRRHHGLRQLERRDGGRGVAGPHGRLRDDAAGRRAPPRAAASRRRSGSRDLAPAAQVRALDATGAVLGQSRVVSS